MTELSTSEGAYWAEVLKKAGPVPENEARPQPRQTTGILVLLGRAQKGGVDHATDHAVPTDLDVLTR